MADNDTQDLAAAVSPPPTPIVPVTPVAAMKPPAIPAGSAPEFEFLSKTAADTPAGQTLLTDIAGKEKTEQSLLNDMRSQIAQSNADLQKFQTQLTDLQKQRNQVMVPTLRNDITQQLPFVMMLGALAGKASKAGAVTGIQAMSSMINGLQSGNQKVYEAAYKKYQDTMDAIDREQKTFTQVYDMVKELNKNQINAIQIAYEAAQTAIGADYKQLGQIENQIKAQQTAYEKVKENKIRTAELNERIRHDHAMETNAKTVVSALNGKTKAENGLARLDGAVQNVNQMYSMMPSIINKYKNWNKGQTVTPESFNKFLVATSNDPEVGQFTALSQSLKTALTGIELPGGRGNMFIEKLIAGNVPNIFSVSGPFLEQQVRNDKALLEQAQKIQRSNVASYDNVLASLGQNVEEMPTYTISPSQLPSDMSVPTKGSIVKGYEFLGGDPSNKNNWKKVP